MQGKSFEELVKEFQISENDDEVRLQILTSFKDGIDIVWTPTDSMFLKYMFPEFSRTLRSGSPQFVDGTKQKIRNVLLELLRVLPINELLTDFLPDILPLLMDIIKLDNEDNALICIGICTDLFKIFQPSLEIQALEFFEIFVDFQKSFDSIISVSFQESVPDEKELKSIRKSCYSFKVISACSVTTTILYQLHRPHLEKGMDSLIPSMINNITSGSSLNSDQRNMTIYVDLVTAQVKTLTLLTSLIRLSLQAMDQYKEVFATYVIQLLRNCKDHSFCECRKELLLIIRHFLATSFRIGFSRCIDSMLDEQLLIGPGTTSNLINYYAFKALAEFVNHEKSQLSVRQLSKVIYTLSKNLHDRSLPLNIQIISGRLIVKLAKEVQRKTDEPHFQRDLLIRIIFTFSHKFQDIKTQIPELRQKIKEHRESLNIYNDDKIVINKNILNKEDEKLNKLQKLSDSYNPESWKEIRPCDLSVLDYQNLEERLKFTEQLMITMISDLESIISDIVKLRPIDLHDSSDDKSIIHQSEECDIIANYFENGINCLEIFLLLNSSLKQNECIVLKFASVFTELDTQSFRQIFSRKIDILFEKIVSTENMPMELIVHEFLKNEKISSIFSDILLHFTFNRMDIICPKNVDDPINSENNHETDESIYENYENFKTNCFNANCESFVIMNLMITVFKTLRLYRKNENVIQLYLDKILTKAMKIAQKEKESINILKLLKELFRNVASSDSVKLNNEFIPLLPKLLECFIAIQSRCSAEERELAIELCLTIPARLSNIFSFIPKLINVVFSALKSENDQIIKIGLRTLKFWIDDLNPEWLYPVMSGGSSSTTLNRLMRSICDLLRSNPHSFGVTALQILGKLGGRNRRFLIQPFELNPRDIQFDELLLQFELISKINDNAELSFPCTKFFDIIYFNFVTNPSECSTVTKVNYVNIAKCLLVSVIDFDKDIRSYVAFSQSHKEMSSNDSDQISTVETAKFYQQH